MRCRSSVVGMLRFEPGDTFGLHNSEQHGMLSRGTSSRRFPGDTLGSAQIEDTGLQHEREHTAASCIGEGATLQQDILLRLPGLSAPSCLAAFCPAASTNCRNDSLLLISTLAGINVAQSYDYEHYHRSKAWMAFTRFSQSISRQHTIYLLYACYFASGIVDAASYAT